MGCVVTLGFGVGVDGGRVGGNVGVAVGGVTELGVGVGVEFVVGVGVGEMVIQDEFATAKR